MAKKFHLICLIGLILVLLVGCGYNNSDSKNVTIQLAGFPCDQSVYYMEIYVWKSGETLKIYPFENVKDEFERQIEVSSDATSIAAYIFDSKESSEPLYFWSFKFASTKNVYSSIYWLNYFAYFNGGGELKYGISESLATTVQSNATVNIDFNDAPYFLYKISGVVNQTLKVKVEITTGCATLEHGYNLTSMNTDYHYIYSGNSENHISVAADSVHDTVYVLVRSGDYYQHTTATITFNGIPQLGINGIISDMVAGSTPDRVYGINKTNAILYYINPVDEKIDKQFSLTDTEPLAMAFSASDNKIYIVSKFSGSVTVWDIVAESSQQFQFSTSADGVDIEVAPGLRRIYVLSTNGLYIINMDTGAVLLSGTSIGNVFALDENRKQLISGTIYYSDANLFRWSVNNDQLSLTQSRLYAGSYGSMLELSPDGNKILFPCSGGHGESGHTVYAFDATNLDNVLGEWDIGPSPLYVTFNPSGTILYGANGNDNYVYVMSAQNYTLIRKLPLDYRNDYTVMTTNSDGSQLVAFTHSFIYDSINFIYFLSDILQTSNLLVSRLKYERDLNFTKLGLQIPESIRYPKRVK